MEPQRIILSQNIASVSSRASSLMSLMSMSPNIIICRHNFVRRMAMLPHLCGSERRELSMPTREKKGAENQDPSLAIHHSVPASAKFVNLILPSPLFDRLGFPRRGLAVSVCPFKIVFMQTVAVCNRECGVEIFDPSHSPPQALIAKHDNHEGARSHHSYPAHRNYSYQCNARSSC
jgi:hypothetical protein